MFHLHKLIPPISFCPSSHPFLNSRQLALYTSIFTGLVYQPVRWGYAAIPKSHHWVTECSGLLLMPPSGYVGWLLLKQTCRVQADARLGNDETRRPYRRLPSPTWNDEKKIPKRSLRGNTLKAAHASFLKLLERILKLCHQTLSNERIPLKSVKSL